MTHYPKITPETLFDAVVVANGAFPKHETLLRILHRTPHVIACDGAAETLLNAGFTAQQITVIGDGDSLAPRLKRQLHFISINEQDDNDLTKATRYVCTQHGQAQPQLTANRRLRIAYLGATGKREDHTLGNIALMVHYYNHFNVQPFMLTDEGIFIAAHGDCSFDVTPRTTNKYLQLWLSTIRMSRITLAHLPFRDTLARHFKRSCALRLADKSR